MRWFFLTFILLLAVVGNAGFFSQWSWLNLIGGIALNLLVILLMVIWWSSYFRASNAKARGLVIGHALLMFAAGIGMATLAANAAIPKSCDDLIFDASSRSSLSQLAAYVNTTGCCRELGVGWVLRGLLLAYPSVRLYIGLTGRSDNRNSIR